MIPRCPSLFRGGLFAAALVLLAAGPAHAGATDKLRAFLQATGTVRAEFSQVVTAKSGRKPQFSSGSMSVQRPDRFRWQIDKPYPQLVVGDGQRIWLYDPDLRQATVRPQARALGGTPAALLAGSDAFEKSFTLADAGEQDGLDWLEATPKTADGGFTRVRVGFLGADLKAMELTDHFGQTTALRFEKLERNPPLPAGLFRFTPPAGTDVVGE